MTPELTNAMARLEKLERQNRRLRAAVGLALAVAALAWLAGPPRLLQADPAKGRVVEAGRLVLRDGTGAKRAELAAEGEETFLRLFDQAGRPRVTLTAKPPGLVLDDEHGQVRAYLYQLGYGAGLDIRDPDGKLRAWMGERKEGPVLQLLGPGEKPLFSRP